MAREVHRGHAAEQARARDGLDDRRSWVVAGAAASRSGIWDLFSRTEHSSVGWSVGSRPCSVEPVRPLRRRSHRLRVASREPVPRRSTPRSRRPCRPGPRCRRRSAAGALAWTSRRPRRVLVVGVSVVASGLVLRARLACSSASPMTSVPRSGIHLGEGRPDRKSQSTNGRAIGRVSDRRASLGAGRYAASR